MIDHFAIAAADVDRGDSSSTAATRAYFAFGLAADWRRGVTITERVGATNDSLLPFACPRH